MPVYAHVAAPVIGPERVILVVFGGAYASKVDNAIVRFNAVNVVDLVWLDTVNQFPDNAMGAIFNAVYVAYLVPVLVDVREGLFAGKAAVPALAEARRGELGQVARLPV